MSPSVTKIPTKYISFHPHVKKGCYIRIYTKTETKEEELILVRQYIQNQLVKDQQDQDTTNSE